jgi:hypothetical protein
LGYGSLRGGLDDAHLTLAFGDLKLRDAGFGDKVDEGFQFTKVHAALVLM